MNRRSWTGLVLTSALAVALTITLSSFQNDPGKTVEQARKDTVPAGRIKDFDEALRELEKGRLELEKSLREQNWQKDFQSAMKEFDADKIKGEIDKAMRDLDLSKMQADLQKSLKELDVDKLKADMQKELSSIDAEKIKLQIEQAVKNVDLAKIQADLSKELEKISSEDLQKNMEKLELNMDRMEEQMKKMGPEIERSLEAGRKSIEEARVELTAYKNFVDDLDKEGLIDKNGTYTIEYKKGELTLNGKKQPASVKEKYEFLKNHKDFTIRKDASDLQISN